MKTIIAGSRGLSGLKLIESAVKASGFEITCVLCGCARGIDTDGASWARLNEVPIAYYPADWATHGRAAGMRRNEQMGDDADALIAIWDGKSRGTAHMIEYATSRNLKVFVYRCS